MTHGKYTSLFEHEIKKFTKAKFAVSVSSCTAGLHISCLASDFKKGDEVIVPAQTHTATAHAVEFTGAVTAGLATYPNPSSEIVTPVIVPPNAPTVIVAFLPLIPPYVESVSEKLE